MLQNVPQPVGTPQPVIARLWSGIQAFMRDPATQARLKDRGLAPVGSSAAEFARTMNDEYESYRKLARDANIKAQ